MREFKFDPVTRHARLNGQPYFLRGTNFTLYRFFEDEDCKLLPWTDDWVRLLHQRVKEMRWNSIRYCIGFPPEAWYEIADELGLLIQDEFPLWRLSDVNHGQLETEYGEWMRERWNHPSVVIWDAQNETITPETGTAISAVRGLDLSGRPWDNGWSPTPGARVIRSNSISIIFRRGVPLTASPSPISPAPKRVPRSNEHKANDGRHAVIINEYALAVVEPRRFAHDADERVSIIMHSANRRARRSDDISTPRILPLKRNSGAVTGRWPR
jgi:hypothetical protein